MVKLQLAMDTLDGDEALRLAASIAPYVDILEAGTPLINLWVSTSFENLEQATRISLFSLT